MQVQTNEQIKASTLGLTGSEDTEARAQAESQATCGDSKPKARQDVPVPASEDEPFECSLRQTSASSSRASRPRVHNFLVRHVGF